MPMANAHEEALRRALVDAVGTKLARDRRRAVARRAALAMVAFLAVVATVVTFTLPDNRADASIEVEVRDGATYVRLLDFESRPDEIVGALRNAGLDVVVDPAPVGPSNVGRFVGIGTTGSGRVDVVGDRTKSFTSFIVRPNFVGQLRLVLGREAAPGEEWRAPSDATAKDEVLECRELRGLTAAEAARALADEPVSVSWLSAFTGNLEPGAELGAYANWRVIDLVAWSDRRVVATLSETGEWPYPGERPPLVPPSCKGK
jgi:hypothetical protein